MALAVQPHGGLRVSQRARGFGQVVERAGYTLPVANASKERQAFGQQRLRPLVLTLLHGNSPEIVKGSGRVRLVAQRAKEGKTSRPQFRRLAVIMAGVRD